MSIYKEKREQTKNSLINSFWEIYEKKSLDKITIKNITDKAGYNRATFYVHFKDINDILQCIENQLFDSFDKMFKLTDIENYDQEYLLKKSIDLFTLNTRYYRLLLSPKGDPYFVETCKEKLKTLFHSIEKNNSSFTSNNVDFFLEYTVSGLISCILYWFESQPFPVEDLFNNLYKLIAACTLLD